MNLLQRIVTTGCSNVKGTSLQEVEDTQRTIRIVNALCLICAVICVSFSVCCHYLLGNQIFVWPAITAALAFFSIICLNGLGKHTLASTLLIVVNNVTIQYYSAVMGRVTEIHLLFIFLIGLSLLLFQKPSQRRMMIGITIGCFMAGEVNMYFGFFPPLLNFVNTVTTEFVIRWVTIPGILVLDLLVFSFYVKHVDRLRNREMLHVQEMLEGVRLHNADLEALTAKLARATDAKTVFVRETSHEIRTPLNAIFGISQLLQLKVAQDRNLAPIRLLADHLYAASFNTREIINNVLEFSRIEAGKADMAESSSLDVREWLENVVNIHQYIAGIKMVRIRYNIAEEMPEFLMADKLLLTKMLNNLLSNAIKFTASESNVFIHIFVKGDRWFITVADEGDGISEDRQSTIFEAFVSERNIFQEGTGLGLHITRHLAEAMGGSIEIKSKKGVGTTFMVNLPLEGVSRQPGKVAAEVPGRMLHLNAAAILIIEDDKMSQMILTRFLSSLGSRVTVAGNGVEGMLLGRASKPDIIILDAHIPGMSGMDTLTQIREDDVLKNVPVIIASGDAFNGASEEMINAGANDYLVKPIEFKALHATLTKYIE
ncbi:ATP-binding protein [Chitinophaga sancti]|uniref:histidine kinase n=1 Tax=Chitinophaga sancti TaxID=1004 RepID=A0A1K1NB51_9BACT|nr:ATP-binding protein [Chitinophaga sancti]WQD63395.1 ATP-binding protein [Chitinophaga sancti]WQG90979.1 ATP-binding protein [Chitinophaga sancti]SFW32505.1 Signal transduction histidine kinase [Chitinophaga sancti]